MSRKRDPQWAWLPKRVYFSKGRFVYVLRYKPWKELYLAPKSASQFEVLNEYVKIQKGLEGNPRDTLQAMVDAYLESSDYKALMPATQEHYTRLLTQATQWEMPRLKAPFGSLRLEQINNKTIQSAYDQQEINVARNRRFKILKIVFSWGKQRFDGVERNPVVGLKLMEEKPRDRYITDVEYKTLYDLASPTLKLMMEGAYLLRARRHELSKLDRFENIKPDGVLIERSKGSWDGVVQWSPRLTKWVSDCRKHNTGNVSRYLIRNESGGKVAKSAHDSTWRRVWAMAPTSLWDRLPTDDDFGEHFTFHDIKAKGITDHPDKEGGHKSPKMRVVYDRENRKEAPTK